MRLFWASEFKSETKFIMICRIANKISINNLHNFHKYGFVAEKDMHNYGENLYYIQNVLVIEFHDIISTLNS